MKIETKVIEIINEDGVAMADAGNTSGMGDVTATSPSTNIGTTIGDAYGDGGGTVGSGDIGFPFYGGKFKGHPISNKKTKKGKKKKGAKHFDLKQDYVKPPKKLGKMKKFSDFVKKK